MAAYETMVVGVHDSPTGRRAVRFAAQAASAGIAENVVLVAAHRGPQRFGMALPEIYQESGEEPARQTLRDAVEAVAELGVEHAAAHAVVGGPVTVLCSKARDLDADLMVVGSHGLSTLGGRLLGSVPGGVSREVPCDVLVVHTTERRVDRLVARLRGNRRGVVPTIVAGVHDSARSRRAAEKAAVIAAETGADLVLVGAFEPAEDRELALASDRLKSESHLVQGSFAIEDVLRDLEARAHTLGAQDVRRIVVRGDAMAGILKVARKRGADLLVLGNHQLSGRLEHLLGSVSDQVSRKTTTHILLVH